MLTHSKVTFLQFLHFLTHVLHQSFPVCNQTLCLIGKILKFIRYFKLKIKYRSLNRNRIRYSLSFIHSEKLKVSTEIKNIKLLLILPIKKSRTKSCSPPYHLPELCLTHNLFKKYKIQHFRYINSRIQHIY